jgi:hypothetical protein
MPSSTTAILPMFRRLPFMRQLLVSRNHSTEPRCHAMPSMDTGPNIRCSTCGTKSSSSSAPSQSPRIRLALGHRGILHDRRSVTADIWTNRGSCRSPTVERLQSATLRADSSMIAPGHRGPTACARICCRCNPVQGATASLALTATLALWNLQLAESKGGARVRIPLSPPNFVVYFQVLTMMSRLLRCNEF